MQIGGFSGLDRTDDGGVSAFTKVSTAALAVVGVLATVDLASDLRQGTTLAHALVEGTIATIGLSAIVWAGAHARRFLVQAAVLRRHSEDLEQRLGASRAEALEWRRQTAELISGLSVAIDGQLERWGLSEAENEVALLLLKGLSHKEIGEIRGVGEATVRQQAGAIYRKAGLSGRHELAAFFLEDLLGPRHA